MTDMTCVRHILNRYGIRIEVSGCGCCGSPTFVFEYDGEMIYDGSNAHIDMLNDHDGEEDR